MTKLLKLAGVALVLGSFITVAGAASATTTHPTYALGHAKSCRVDYVKRTEREKVKGKTRRYVACVYVAPKLTLMVAGPSATTPTTVAVTNVKANIDPSWSLATTIPQAPPVPVTFYYSAGVTDGTLPSGELTLSIFVHGSVSNAGGCQANVGGANSSAQCTVSVPQWGQYDLITSYSSGVSNVASTGATETVDVEPPAQSGITVVGVWGTTSPTSGVAISAQVVGSSAAVTLANANFEGATSIGLTDQLGDTCTATVSGTTATCNMALTGTPTTFTVNYPGGVSTVGSQTLSPWGIPQSQQVTLAWPSENVLVSHPTVTTQVADVEWQIARISGQLNWNPSQGFGGLPGPNTIIDSGHATLFLDAGTTGTASGDPFPIGYLDYEVSGTGGFTTVNESGVPGSADCSDIQNFSSEAEGGCNIEFSGPGTFTVSVTYVSLDPNYTNETDPFTININVVS